MTERACSNFSSQTDAQMNLRGVLWQDCQDNTMHAVTVLERIRAKAD